MGKIIGFCIITFSLFIGYVMIHGVNSISEINKDSSDKDFNYKAFYSMYSEIMNNKDNINKMQKDLDFFRRKKDLSDSDMINIIKLQDNLYKAKQDLADEKYDYNHKAKLFSKEIFKAVNLPEEIL